MSARESNKVHKQTRRRCLCLLITLAISISSIGRLAAETNIPFALKPLSAWSEKSFAGNTLYQVLEQDGDTVLKAQSKASASGLFLEKTIDLEKTPYLNWSWRVENTLKNVNEQTKDGDDYPARVYILISGGMLFWRTRALNYVWSSRQAINSHWPNAFTENATMLVVASGEQQLGQWQTVKRNVLADIKQYLGLDTTTIDGIAVMTDTDNSGQQATAYYKNIYFSAK